VRKSHPDACRREEGSTWRVLAETPNHGLNKEDPLRSFASLLARAFGVAKNIFYEGVNSLKIEVTK